ncbi:MAG: prepilin peptidase [Nitrospirae bacterium]|nr:prepilin peptidase [Nitrospirota bacterium]
MILADMTVLTLLAALLLIAIINDLRFRKVPNILTYPAMVTAIAYNSSLSGLEGLLFSVEGIGLGIGVLILFYFAGGMGAGDVKLLGAVGGFLGPQGVFIAFLFIAIIGGIHALTVLTFKGYVKEALKRYYLMLKAFILTGRIVFIPPSGGEMKLRLCYGVSIAIGTFLAVVLESRIMTLV